MSDTSPVYVRDIASEVVALSAREWGLELVSRWIGRRYQELCAQAKFRHLRRVRQLYLPAPLTTGTFTATLGSPLITADSTATAAMTAYAGAPNSIVGQWWRINQGSVWYKIVDINPSSSSAWVLTLETPYASDNTGAAVFANNTASNLSYYIIPRYVALDQNARQIGTMVIPAMYRPLNLKSEDELNMLYSNRFLVAYPPRDYAIVNSDDSVQGQPKMAEFYPYPQASTTIAYTCWNTPPFLTLDDLVPPTIDRDILKTGALCDSWYNASAQFLKEGKVEQSTTARNYANQEETRYMGKIARAIRNDRGADDLKFILRRYRSRVPLDFDPDQTAAEDWYMRGGISG